MARLMTFLPDSWTLGDGTVLKERIHTLDVRDVRDTCDRLRHARIRYRVIDVLGRNLRGKLDLYNKPYTPNRWILAARQLPPRQSDKSPA